MVWYANVSEFSTWYEDMLVHKHNNQPPIHKWEHKWLPNTKPLREVTDKVELDDISFKGYYLTLSLFFELNWNVVCLNMPSGLHWFTINHIIQSFENMRMWDHPKTVLLLSGFESHTPLGPQKPYAIYHTSVYCNSIRSWTHNVESTAHIINTNFHPLEKKE